MNENNLHNDPLTGAESDDFDLRKEAPLLGGLKKQEPFRAPEGFFEKFQLELQDKIHSNRANWWDLFLKPLVWAPTMVILIATGIFIFKENEPITTKSTATNEKLKLNEISFEVLDAYVNDHLLAQVNTDEIMEIMGLDIPSLGSFNASENKIETIPSIQHVKEEEMEEYIIENMDEMEVY
jgi:hypothetical protein